ncbi:uncharacterized protein [Prorops nasuta]|uniref:uncharacterized protein n=1 Tax=Prorops nasuta TaxID=863751 RepID=UPI0034CF400A
MKFLALTLTAALLTISSAQDILRLPSAYRDGVKWQIGVHQDVMTHPYQFGLGTVGVFGRSNIADVEHGHQHQVQHQHHQQQQQQQQHHGVVGQVGHVPSVQVHQPGQEGFVNHHVDTTVHPGVGIGVGNQVGSSEYPTHHTTTYVGTEQGGNVVGQVGQVGQTGHVQHGSGVHVPHGQVGQVPTVQVPGTQQHHQFGQVGSSGVQVPVGQQGSGSNVVGTGQQQGPWNQVGQNGQVGPQVPIGQGVNGQGVHGQVGQGQVGYYPPGQVGQPSYVVGRQGGHVPSGQFGTVGATGKMVTFYQNDYVTPRHYGLHQQMHHHQVVPQVNTVPHYQFPSQHHHTSVTH